ncbi:hypothetical protein PC115_g21257 [Phytophthora cactorum]|uniref:Uncharacterized protein n=1 Tax=Phytophthora cactorum TaxID=29920 RepID=A0A8T1AKD9_9STRA|nr:hypothetical protein PC115_g21257 [Phytophthora cactorum]KAG2903454.1 hypothetical protein PC117_g21251 [Phytophthora cactorum]KAG3001152.1 hypothetical protein PC120_g20446 [Phytophthora cactorum]KAG3067288.1 hypothetical protein PC122_g17414 [Phytophthora cactorum]KAG4043478.1 hypothetical protein PC123_g21053 [Phytophthora cactorum]
MKRRNSQLVLLLVEERGNNFAHDNRLESHFGINSQSLIENPAACPSCVDKFSNAPYLLPHSARGYFRRDRH